METNIAPNTPEITPELENRIWKLNIRGCTRDRIADTLGLDPLVVPALLKTIRARRAAEYTAEKVERIAEQTDRLLHIVNEALDAWEASKQQPEPTRSEPHTATPASAEPQQVLPGCTQPPSTLQNPPTNTGRPAYLRIALQALKALQQIHALREIDTPARDDFQSPPCPTKTLIGIDMERFRNGLGDPADDPQIQPV